ncbi:pseudouridine-5'-phosphatase-like [Myzus persicae]|uniref:pseudouridine-5'-phosphatase-like n=1 Tax=Myzus persicae TaxID=13164 RepID=UPI000B92FD2E|nr:pseudouridine-5'-phosphatase-like [Myzus persicae]
MRLPVEITQIVKNVCRSFSTKKLNPVSHVIFDMDGVLLDTENIHKQSVTAVASKFGKTYNLDLRYRVLGAPEFDGAKMIVNELNLPISVEEFIIMVHAFENKVLSDVGILPGVDRLVRHLNKNKIPFAIATSSTKKSFDLKTSKHKSLFSLFNHIVCGGCDPEVKNGKPAPDIFLKCASRFPDQPDPNKCLVFEDSPNGVRGAKEAGMQVVMVPDNLLPKDSCTEATLVLGSIEDFVPEAFGLPSFN